MGLNLSKNDYSNLSLNYQQSLPINLEHKIPEGDPVRLLDYLIESINLEALLKTYSADHRQKFNKATPRQLLKILIYGYMNSDFSGREIEKACRRDINFMYLLNGADAPDHTTIDRFRTKHFAKCAKEVLAEITSLLNKLGAIDEETVYIDGTKIEANANKYSFVWKKAVQKNLAKRLQKVNDELADELPELGIECDLEGRKIDTTPASDVNIALDKLRRAHAVVMKKVADEKIEFVHGSGRKKPFYQSVAESLEENIRKLEEYKEELAICGERNSYSKTDKDATFMRLKEDPMLNGQLKPAYNVQHCLDSDFIVWITLSSHPTDTMTLPSTLDDMYEHLGFRYKNVTADAGYESEENYVYLEGHGQLAYIKPNNYEISKTRKYKKDIGRSCNMKYDADEDSYTCKNGKKLTKTGISHVKHKSGYVSETTIYKCAECKGCPYKTQCIKGNNCKTPMEERNKVLYVSKKMEEERAADLERLVNDDGIRYRLNRSIQAEGSFAVTKEDLKFRRYLCRHFVNVQAESILIAIAYDVLKLDEKVSHGRLDVHYHPKSDVKDGKNRSNAA